MAEEKVGALQAMFDVDAKTVKKRSGSGGQDSGSGQYAQVTINGYEKHEVVSALQKAIRRGNEAGALYWASELMQSEASYQMWRRLLVIAAEDVGLADPDMVMRIMLMKQAHDMGREWNIPFLAVMLLCRSPKNREADDAAYLYELKRKEGWKIPMPPEAQDGHTGVGRRRLYQIARDTGEDWERVWCREFYYDAALLKNYLPDGTEESTQDKWRRRLMKHLQLPFQTYDIETCPEPRILSGGARVQHDSYEEARTAAKIPKEIDVRRFDPSSGDELPTDVYTVKSFTNDEAWYVVNMNEDTCTCQAYANGGGNPCKHILAVGRWRADL